MAILSAEVAIFCRRKKQPYQYLFWAAMVLFSVGTFFWLIYRGDLNSDDWLRRIF